MGEVGRGWVVVVALDVVVAAIVVVVDCAEVVVVVTVVVKASGSAVQAATNSARTTRERRIEVEMLRRYADQAESATIRSGPIEGAPDRQMGERREGLIDDDCQFDALRPGIEHVDGFDVDIGVGQ